MILYIVISIAIFIIIFLEFLREKYKIEEISKKSKEILDKYNEKKDEKILMEVLNIQKIFFQYFIITTIVTIIPLFYILSLSKPSFEIIDNTTLKLHNLYKNHEIAVYYEGRLLGIYKADENAVLALDNEITSKDIKLEVIVIKLPFKLPIFNKEWLSTFGSYLIFYFLLSFVSSIIKRIYKFIHKTRTNG